MSTEASGTTRPTDQNSTVRDYLPTGAERLGIDTDGRIHYWAQARQTVIVVTPTGVGAARIATYDVTPGRAFAKYVGHADDIVGWESLQYDEEWLNGLSEVDA